MSPHPPEVAAAADALIEQAQQRARQLVEEYATREGMTLSEEDLLLVEIGADAGVAATLEIVGRVAG